MGPEDENLRFKQFLLGSLEEAAAEELGGRIIFEADLDEKLSFAEADLVEDFLDGALTAGETELFYQNFLTTPERIELLEEIAALKSQAKIYFEKVSAESSGEKKPADLFDSLKSFFFLSLRPIVAVLVVAVLVGIGWRVFFYDAGLSAVEKEYAALNARDLSNPAETANFTTKSLIPGTFRDSGPAGKMVAAELSANVLFRLALPAETTPAARFDLELVRGGQTVFRQLGLKSYQNAAGRELKAVLPKSVLTPGVYQIKLSSGSIYGFAVE